MQDPQQSKSGEVRHETSLERLDRNLEELTGELRVVVTGVQVLFAFLLILPFNSGFAQLSASGGGKSSRALASLLSAIHCRKCAIKRLLGLRPAQRRAHPP